jgi:hypothetical protein
MNLTLLKQSKKIPHLVAALMLAAFTFCSTQSHAQGAWTALTTAAPDQNGGVMLLLSDGSVMCKTFSGGTDGYGTEWDRLIPDSNGSYVNGTWATMAAMHNTRLYFASQVLKNGQVYVAGGEYGGGSAKGEVYDPLTDTWTNTPNPGTSILDGNSEILDNGTVIQAFQGGSQQTTSIYDPVTNTYSAGPNTHGSYDESAWVKLADGSILYVNINSTASERYIPAQNKWVVDATVPVSLYDPYGEEAGAGFLLPDGRVFFLGSPGTSAFYTPSGTASPGTWAAGPNIPNSQGTPDAAAAMMVNGKILCAVSPVPTSANHFPSPTSFYIFDSRVDSFTRIHAPEGGLTTNISSYVTNMVDLPDGSVLYSEQGGTQYYVFKPTGKQIEVGKPAVKKKIIKNGDGSYTMTGFRFNGISEGAAYGDDWQMATNYPIVRLTAGTRVYYARTFNWNHTGVQTGTLADTAEFTLPSGLPKGTYSLEVIANGISSNPITFKTTVVGLKDNGDNDNVLTASAEPAAKTAIYPNPAKDAATLAFTLANATHVNVVMYDISGKHVQTVMNGQMEKGDHTLRISTAQLTKGVYFVTIATSTGIKTEKLVVE